MIVKIDNIKFSVKDNEFNLTPSLPGLENLKNLKDVSFYEILFGLITDLCNDLNINNFLHLNPTHGGFLICKLFNESSFINLSYIIQNYKDTENVNNIYENFKNHNVNLVNYLPNIPSIILIENKYNLNTNLIKINIDCIYISLELEELNCRFNNKIKISKLNLWLYFSDKYKKIFNDNFHYYIENNELNYDNLINLCIMVKNGGDTFKQVLQENLHIIDKWTILDTGSTDSTIDVVKEVLVDKKKGKLFIEPFINFKDSRNRLLELAGKSCKYTLMLDDTYIIKGSLRKFLDISRGDQFSTSFSLFIKSYDSEYISNRLIKTNSNLKYIYKIHEVITPKNNINVVIPIQYSYILDITSEYMEKRTDNRKKLDLKLLQEELDENPRNTRTYYYFGTTYKGLKQYDKAYEWFLKRVNHEKQGFIHEKVESCLEAARLSHFMLNNPWEETKLLYEKTISLDSNIPEPYYFIGIYYYLQNDFLNSHIYFKKAYKIGYPSHHQFSLKPTLSFHFCPKFLCETCLHNKDFKLGEEVSSFYLTNGYNKPNEDSQYPVISSWYNLFKKINSLPTLCSIYNIKNINNLEKPIFCFVADGGFKPWSGSTINKEGVGGSETYIIEMARYIQKTGQYNVYVFCNCDKSEIFEEVNYLHLNIFPEFIMNNIVQHCIISRFTEYIPMTYDSYVENVYLVLHDIAREKEVIPLNHKLKKIFCLSEWHVENFINYFSILANKTVPFYYGVDFNKFKIDDLSQKIPFKFIYSSYPNRGLLELLKIWPRIYEIEQRCTLHIYSNVDNKWSNDVEPNKMKEIKNLLTKYKSYETNLGIYYHSWVSKKELSESWKTAEYWLYPCTFKETFCLTALEAAISKTLAITNNLAALQNTVSDRGIIIDGDPSTLEWQNNTIEKIKEIFNNKQLQSLKIEENYKWASKLTWENQANKLLNNYINNNDLIQLNNENWFNNDSLYETISNTLNNISFKFENLNVLEISNDTCTSIIYIHKILKNSCCYYLNEIKEESYKKVITANLKKYNLTNTINVFLIKINHKLIDFYNNKNFMHLIHINCENFEYNLYLYLQLSWNILVKDGILLLTFYDINQLIQKSQQIDKIKIINNFLYNNNITSIIENNCLIITK